MIYAPAPNSTDLKVDPSLGPLDSVSCMHWLNNRTFAVSSWAGELKVYECAPESNSIKSLRSYQLPDQVPILCITFKDDGSKIFTGLGDGRLGAYDVNTQQWAQLAQHPQAISSIHYVPQINMLVTADFDKKIIFYNVTPQGQTTQALALQLEHKIHAMDIKYPMLVAGCANNKVWLYDITKVQFIQGGQVTSQYYTECILNSNISCVSLFNDQTAYCVGTYDGRANISKIIKDNTGSVKNGDSIICFKCQKFDNPVANSQVLVPVNSIVGQVRGKHNCVTVGSDGIINVWDYVLKNKAVQFNVNMPVSRCAVSPDGQFLCYALGYDWHNGINGFEPQQQRPQIFIHYLKEEELQSKKN